MPRNTIMLPFAPIATASGTCPRRSGIGRFGVSDDMTYDEDDDDDNNNGTEGD